jgi:large subunit ribosomal protein L10
MDTETKHRLAEELRDRIADADALVLVGYSAMTVATANDLRSKFREAGCSYRVFKNSTIHWAIQGTRHEPLSELLKGVSALAFNLDDPGAPARVARDFAKTNELFVVKGGVADGRLLDKTGVETLADMPGPRELKAMFLALLNTPATSMVRVLNAAAQQMLNVLNARKEALEKA